MIGVDRASNQWGPLNSSRRRALFALVCLACLGLLIFSRGTQSSTAGGYFDDTPGHRDYYTRPRAPPDLSSRDKSLFVFDYKNGPQAMAKVMESSTSSNDDSEVSGKGTEFYFVGVVADRDRSSKSEGGKTWGSVVKTLWLSRSGLGSGSSKKVSYSVSFSREDELRTRTAEAGRAMELSDLVLFGDKLISMDDRTGIVFEVKLPSFTSTDKPAKAIPRQILMDGNGESEKGFKGEWATVKDGLLYVGGMGKEWTDNSGNIISTNPCWVKTMDTAGGLSHEDWTQRYRLIREKTGYTHPGYILHEAVSWHPQRRRWYFLPRRASRLPYNDVEDERRATNILISADESFKNIETTTIGPLELTRGFSSFKFVPGHPDEIVATKSQEVGDEIASFLMVFSLDGEVLMEEIPLGRVKFEGVEFIPKRIVNKLIR